MATPHKANKEALGKVNDQLECAICLKPYTSPKVLPCFHVYCINCLEPMVTQGQNGPTITCPKCRRPAPIPQAGVLGLQSAFHVTHLFDIRDTLEKAKDPKKVQCEKCKEATATGYCRDCAKFVCDACTKVHQKWDELANHQIVGISEIQDESASLARPKGKVIYCSKHRDTALKIFCETCQELICIDCTVRLHKDHEYDLVTDTFPKHRDEIKAHLQPVRHYLDTVSTSLKALETRKEEIKKRRTTLRHDIDELVTQIHKALDERKGELVRQLDQTTEQKLYSLAEQEEGITTLQTQLSSCVEFVESSLKTGTEGEILAMKAAVVKQIQEIVPAINPDTLRPQEIDNLYLVDLTESCRKFAAITTTVSTYVTGDGVQTATIGVQAEVVLHCKEEGRGGVIRAADVNARLVCGQPATEIQCNVEKVGESECRIRYTPTTSGKQQLHITLGGRHTNGSPHSVVVRPRSQDLQKPIKVLGNMKHPFGITTDSKGRIIVTEVGAYCVTVFTPDGDKLRSFGSQGSGIGQFKSPYGVAVDSDDNIYVGDLINHRIQKFSLAGEPLASVGCKGSKPLEFDNSCSHITFNPRDGNLYICDMGNRRIQILDTELAFCRMISGQQGGTGKFRYPQGVAFDSDGNVYIAARVHIQVFSPEGRHLREIGSEGNEPGQLQDAEGIAIDHDRVYVTDYDNNRVSIFTTTGQFLHSFGSDGTRPGQFKNPRGITIDGNGHILVTDGNNGRIQIF